MKGRVLFLHQDFHSAIRLLTSVDFNYVFERKSMILLFQLQCLRLQ